MFLKDKWRPLLAPDVEGGATDVDDSVANTPPPQPDGPGSGRSELRKQLEKSAEDVRKNDAARNRDGTGRYKSSRAREEMGDPAQPADGEQPEAGSEQGAETQIQPPAAWAKEAKAEWANLPPTVQAAVAKREADAAKGVEDLKKKYSEIDAALQPRAETLKRTGHTAAQAINQLFLWFEALSMDAERIKKGQPAQAFTALMQSFGIDPRGIFGQQPQQQQPQQQAQQPAEGTPEIPEAVQKWMQTQFGQLTNAFGQKFNAIEGALQAQNQAKTVELLNIWAKDKPYFEDVRGMMAHLISSGAVAALPNGNADLDKAYDMALYALPEVRAKVLAEQTQREDAARKASTDAERKAQQDLANKARRASVSTAPSAPGSQPDPMRGGRRAKSVAESIREAIKEVSQ